ncbi:hypothetical protein D9M69_681660 [compost metagenome]
MVLASSGSFQVEKRRRGSRILPAKISGSPVALAQLYSMTPGTLDEWLRSRYFASVISCRSAWMPICDHICTMARAIS